MAWIRIPSAALAGLLVAGAAIACPLEAVRERLDRADEHLFWTEFWTETDDAEAHRELAYAIDDLRRADFLLRGESCADDATMHDLKRMVRQRLAVCVRQRDASANTGIGQGLRHDR